MYRLVESGQIKHIIKCKYIPAGSTVNAVGQALGVGFACTMSGRFNAGAMTLRPAEVTSSIRDLPSQQENANDTAQSHLLSKHPQLT